MFVANIEDEIIYWLQNDGKAREYALYWSRPGFKDTRSRHLLDMIETQFAGLHVPRDNESGSGETGVYLCVIENTWEILPKTLTQELFGAIGAVLSTPEYQNKFAASYPDIVGDNRHINQAIEDDYDWKKWLLEVFQMYKQYYNNTVFGSIDLIHYIDLSKKLVNAQTAYAVSASQAADTINPALLTRW